jgi:AcrR family transcriptional regulator
MVRWEPDASGRLRAAALELYVERGFEQTTVADIAARAGLTARTFFRYYADKREVLFAGSEAVNEAVTKALAEAPDSAAPMAAVARALDAVGELITDHEFSRRRQAVIVANAELRERELIKLASLSDTLAEGLRRRGVEEPAARLAAETGIAVFRVAFERWVAQPRDRGLRKFMGESFDQLSALTATGRSRAHARPPRAHAGGRRPS